MSPLGWLGRKTSTQTNRPFKRYGHLLISIFMRAKASVKEIWHSGSQVAWMQKNKNHKNISDRSSILTIFSFLHLYAWQSLGQCNLALVKSIGWIVFVSTSMPNIVKIFTTGYSAMTIFSNWPYIFAYWPHIFANTTHFCWLEMDGHTRWF